MIWWVLQADRLSLEKADLSNLESSVDWLVIKSWQANDKLQMHVRFDVHLNGGSYELELIYPTVFPDCPPMILTVDRSRISGHQYGAAGELCLEHRPDNWHESITGADMVRSCHKLLALENPNANTVNNAPSDHIDSVSREMRSNSLRFAIAKSDLNALNELSLNRPTSIVSNVRINQSSIICYLRHIGNDEDPIWSSDIHLAKEDFRKKGFAIRTSSTIENDHDDVVQLSTYLEESDYADVSIAVANSPEPMCLLIGDQSNWKFLTVSGRKEARKVYRYKMLVIPKAKTRIPMSYKILNTKKVGIIGTGSIGSKVAVSLCRSGIGRFFLLDDDIFYPDNIVRNELSLRDVGEHKVYSLKERLTNINPKCEVNALRVALGGQESANSMNSALEALSDCDVLVDATAESCVFNLVASIAKRQKIPMVWAHVFAGGIGGLVARAAPDCDPPPLSVRNQIETWCEDQNVEWIYGDKANSYGIDLEVESPMVANDSEVTIIASHATRFVIDLLVSANESIFPNSAYMVGLAPEWLFDQPFQTWPIDLKPEGSWGENYDQITQEDILKLMNEYLPPKSTDADTATQ